MSATEPADVALEFDRAWSDPPGARVDVGDRPQDHRAKDVTPSAFSPRTGLLYIPAHNTCMDYEGIEANYMAGTPYLGADVRMYPGPGGYQGELVAWDVARNRKAWGVKDLKFPIYSGVLAIAGDVVFYGTIDGWFKAVDARTGNELWQFHCASGIVGNPMTYLGPDGKQYVAVYAGIGGWMGSVAFPEISADDPYAGLGVVGAMKDIKKYTAAGSTVYVFGLSRAGADAGARGGSRRPARGLRRPQQPPLLARQRRRIRKPDRDAPGATHSCRARTGPCASARSTTRGSAA